MPHDLARIDMACITPNPTMASSILSLAPQLFDRILGFDDSSHLSLMLFCLGNSRLTELLQQGITYIELRNEAELDECYMPWYLTQLHSLRHLIIDRSLGSHHHLNKRVPITSTHLHRLKNRNRTVEITKRLPKEMESIVFRFAHSTTLFFPKDDTQPYIDPGKSFPGLKCLHLDHLTPWTKSGLLSLPSTITNLKITLMIQPNAERDDLIATLPHSLLQLAVLNDEGSFLTTSFYSHLPPYLTSLALFSGHNFSAGSVRPQDLDPQGLLQLPRSLTSVYFNRYPVFMKGIRALDPTFELSIGGGGLVVDEWKPETGAALPPFLSSLIMCTYQGSRPYKMLSSIPMHVAHLDVRGAPQFDAKAIQALPRHLTSLAARFINVKGLKSEHFPPTLRSLHVVTIEKRFSSSQISLLPPLTRLQYYAFLAPKHIPLLPHTITSLKALMNDLEVEKDISFPRNLKYLDLSTTATSSLYGCKNKKGKIELIKSKHDYLPQPQAYFLARCFRLAWISSLNLASLQLSGKSCPIPYSDLLHLPASLTFLDIDMLYHDSLFDASNQELMARAAELDPDLDVGLRPSDQYIASLLPKLLPRNLNHLSLIGHLDIPYESWRYLPPLIQNLTLFGPEPLDQEIVNFIPMSVIRGLTLHLKDIDDEHFLRIPPRLRWLNIYSAKSPVSISEHIPINSNLFLIHNAYLLPALTTRIDDARRVNDDSN